MKNQTGIKTAEDFQNGGQFLNLEGFTNLEKAVTSETFKADYPQDQYEIFSAKSISHYMTNVLRAKDDSLIKGAKDELGTLKPIYVKDNEDNLSKFYVREKVKDLVKGVMDDLGSYGGKADVSFSKTGKQIKEKIEAVLGNINSKLLLQKSAMTGYLEKIGFMPTRELDSWEARSLPAELGSFKRFSWEQTSYDDRNNGGSAYLGKTDESVVSQTKTACSKEEAENCRNYNSALDTYLECMRDKLKAEAFIRNIDWKKSYDLSLNQLTSLGF